MTLAIRDELVGRLDQELSLAYPDTPLMVANQPFDQVDLPDQFIEVDYELVGGDAVFLGLGSPTRVAGYIYVRAHTRRGAGTRWGAEVCETVFRFLRGATFKSFNTQHPEYSRPGETAHHHIQTVKCRLWADLL